MSLWSNPFWLVALRAHGRYQRFTKAILVLKPKNKTYVLVVYWSLVFALDIMTVKHAFADVPHKRVPIFYFENSYGGTFIKQQVMPRAIFVLYCVFSQPKLKSVIRPLPDPPSLPF